MYPLTPTIRKHQAIRILFACPAEAPPKAIVNFMIILYMEKYTHLLLYKVDLENQPFDPNAVWRYTPKPQQLRRPRTSARLLALF